MFMTTIISLIIFNNLLLDRRIKNNCKTIDIIVIVFLNSNFYSPVSGDYSCYKPQLEITIWPKQKDIYIHWKIENFYENDWIGLYENAYLRSNPYVNLKSKLVVNQRVGLFQTKQIYKYQIPQEELFNVEERCLGYFAVYWRVFTDGLRVVVSTCFKTNSKWMEHYWDIIKDRPFNTLFIPGTHDSASYEGINHNAVSKLSSLNKLSDVFSLVKHTKQQILPLINSYAITQDLRVFNQLTLGIRYLDVRVLLEDNIYWTHHAGFYMVPLQTVINDVLAFVLLTKKEVVIFDIHDIQKTVLGNMITSELFSDNDHIEFINWLKMKFAFKDVPLWIKNSPNNSWDKTLEEITLNGGKIIITYANKIQQERNSDFLWPAVQHLWGDKQNINDLITFIINSITKTKATACAVMAELTMDIFSIFTSTFLNLDFDGLRGKANMIAQKIYYLFRDYNIGSKTNILAVDFPRAMGAVRAALIWNERLALNRDDGAKSNCDPIGFYGDNYYQYNELPHELL